MKLRSGRIISGESHIKSKSKKLSLPPKRALDLFCIHRHRDSKCLRDRVVKIARDGNCFFECLRRRLPYSISVKRLRNQFAKWLEQNLEHIEDSLDFDIIRRDGYFNNEETDYAVSLAHLILGVDVVIYTEDGGFVVNGDVAERPPAGGSDTITLYRHNNLHFDLILEEGQNLYPVK